MKTLGSFISKKNLTKKPLVDEKSVFYIFQIVIKSEYGRIGSENIKPVFFRDKKIFIKVTGQTWESEIGLNKGNIISKVNAQLGGEEIADLVMSN